MAAIGAVTTYPVTADIYDTGVTFTPDFNSQWPLTREDNKTGGRSKTKWYHYLLTDLVLGSSSRFIYDRWAFEDLDQPYFQFAPNVSRGGQTITGHRGRAQPNVKIDRRTIEELPYGPVIDGGGDGRYSQGILRIEHEWETDDNGRIIGGSGMYPFYMSPKFEVDHRGPGAGAPLPNLWNVDTHELWKIGSRFLLPTPPPGLPAVAQRGALTQRFALEGGSLLPFRSEPPIEYQDILETTLGLTDRFSRCYRESWIPTLTDPEVAGPNARHIVPWDWDDLWYQTGRQKAKPKAAALRTPGAANASGDDEYQSRIQTLEALSLVLRTHPFFEPAFNPFGVNGVHESCIPTLSRLEGMRQGPSGNNPAWYSLDPSLTTFPYANDTVHAVAIDMQGRSYLGGDFTQLEGRPVSGVVRLHEDGTLDSAFRMHRHTINTLGEGYHVSDILLDPASPQGLDNPRVLAAFHWPDPDPFLQSHSDGHRFTEIIRLTPNGQIDNAFRTNYLNGPNAVPPFRVVRALVPEGDSGNVLVGGRGEDQGQLVRLRPDGSRDPAFTPRINGTVWSIAVDTQGRIIIGGDFTAVNGVSRHRLARLNPDGSVDSLFDYAADDRVAALALISTNDQDVLLLGGRFQRVWNKRFNTARHLSQIRPNFAAVNMTIGDPLPLAEFPVTDGVVNTITWDPLAGHVYILGRFTKVAEHTAHYLARLRLEGDSSGPRLRFDPSFGQAGFDGPLLDVAVDPRPRRTRPTIRPAVTDVSVDMTEDLAGGIRDMTMYEYIANRPDNVFTATLDVKYHRARDSLEHEALARGWHLDTRGRVLVGGRFTKVGRDDRQAFTARLDRCGQVERFTGSRESDLLFDHSGYVDNHGGFTAKELMELPIWKNPVHGLPITVQIVSPSVQGGGNPGYRSFTEGETKVVLRFWNQFSHRIPVLADFDSDRVQVPIGAYWNANAFFYGTDYAPIQMYCPHDPEARWLTEVGKDGAGLFSLVPVFTETGGARLGVWYSATWEVMRTHLEHDVYRSEPIDRFIPPAAREDECADLTVTNRFSVLINQSDPQKCLKPEWLEYLEQYTAAIAVWMVIMPALAGAPLPMMLAGALKLGVGAKIPAYIAYNAFMTTARIGDLIWQMEASRRLERDENMTDEEWQEARAERAKAVRSAAIGLAFQTAWLGLSTASWASAHVLNPKLTGEITPRHGPVPTEYIHTGGIAKLGNTSFLGLAMFDAAANAYLEDDYRGYALTFDSNGEYDGSLGVVLMALNLSAHMVMGDFRS